MITTDTIYTMKHEELDRWIIENVMEWRALPFDALQGLFDPEVYIEFPACVFNPRTEVYEMFPHSKARHPIPFSPSTFPESATAALDKISDRDGWTYSILRGSASERQAILRALKWKLATEDEERDGEGIFVVLARKGLCVLGHGPLLPLAAARAVCQTFGKPDERGFVTSKEILEQTGVKSVQTLMNWTKLGILPSPRVTAQKNGRGSIAWFPYFALDRVSMILDLKRQGYGIRRIKKILDVVGR